jgi:hypothetical protein
VGQVQSKGGTVQVVAENCFKAVRTIFWLPVAKKISLQWSKFFYHKNMTGISAATSTLMESNISSTKGTTKNITVAVVPSLRSKLLASSSRRMPNQVLKAHEERMACQS